MIKYEDYNLPCWLLNQGKAHQDFIRSDFDYNTRQRRALRGYDSIGVRLSLDLGQVIEFKKFWLATNYGTEKFLTDMLVFGDPTLNKTVRFTSSYNLSETSYNRYSITCTAEIVKTTIESTLLDVCPLAPHNGLVPMTGLTPC